MTLCCFVSCCDFHYFISAQSPSNRGLNITTETHYLVKLHRSRSRVSLSMGSLSERGCWPWRSNKEWHQLWLIFNYMFYSQCEWAVGLQASLSSHIRTYPYKCLLLCDSSTYTQISEEAVQILSLGKVNNSSMLLRHGKWHIDFKCVEIVLHSYKMIPNSIFNVYDSIITFSES